MGIKPGYSKTNGPNICAGQLDHVCCIDNPFGDHWGGTSGRLADIWRGVTQAIFLVVLIPALGLVIQIGELNNLLGLITFPLFLLAISSAIALCFERYAADLTHHRKTFLTLIGWQQGVNLHTILVLLAYLVFGLVGFLGLSTRLVFAALLSLPVGLFQIWLILRIADGNKPAWRMLRFVALALPLVTAYLLLLTLWIG